MDKNFALQLDSTAPVQVAKRLLRATRYLQLDGVEVAMASDLDGCPLVHGSLSGEVMVTLGDDPALMLTCAVEPVAEDAVDFAHARYIVRHGSPKAEGAYHRLVPQKAALSTGEVLIPADLMTDGAGDLRAYERRAVDHMNDDHLDAVKSYAEVLLGADAGEWRLASLDMEGLDLVRCDANGTDFRRLWFHPPLAAPGDIKSKLVELAMAGRA